MTQPKIIAFNLLYVHAGHLTGPGYYAVELFEHVLKLPPAQREGLKIFAYVQPEARHHFTAEAQAFLRDVPVSGGRIKRVIKEQVSLPFRSRRDRVDLLFSPTFVSPLWGAPHLAVTVLDMYYRVIPALIDQFQRRYWSIMIPASVWASDRVITISESSRRDVEHFIPNARGKTAAIPLASRFSGAPPAPSTAPPAETGEPFVLMVANLFANKNPDVVVAALARLREKGIALRLLHVGKDHLGFLAKAVGQHGAQDYVSSLGKVSDERLVELYRACHCVVIASLYEGFGIPAVEAQSLGAPLISSDRGSLPEAGGDGALYFDPLDDATLAAHLERITIDPDFREELRARGTQSAARFSWSLTAQRTLDELKSVLED